MSISIKIGQVPHSTHAALFCTCIVRLNQNGTQKVENASFKTESFEFGYLFEFFSRILVMIRDTRKFGLATKAVNSFRASW